MKLSSVDARILAALGLIAAGATGCTTTSACLSPDIEADTSACLGVMATETSPPFATTGGSSTGGSSTGGSSTGGADATTDGGDVETGTTSSTGTSGSDTDATDSGDTTGTSGAAALEDDVTDRVLRSGALPPDVAARLRRGG